MSLIDKLMSVFRPTAEALAVREFDEARLRLLEAESAREYADAMVTYHQRRIARLKAMINSP